MAGLIGRHRNALLIVTVVLLVAGVLSALATGGRDGATGARSQERKPDHAAVPGGPADSRPGADGAPSAAPPTSIESKSPGTHTPRSSADAPEGEAAPGWPVRPRPRPGEYEFTVASNGERRDERATVAVNADGTFQITTGPDTDTFATPNQSVTVLRRVSKVRNGEARCEWDPPLVVVPPLREGAAWEVEAKCRPYTRSGAKVDYEGETRKVTGRVVAPEHLTIAGQRVSTWKIEVTTERSWPPPPGGQPRSDEGIVTASSMRTTATLWWAPELGLFAREMSKTTSEIGSFSEERALKTLPTA